MFGGEGGPERSAPKTGEVPAGRMLIGSKGDRGTRAPWAAIAEQGVATPPGVAGWRLLCTKNSHRDCSQMGMGANYALTRWRWVSVAAQGSRGNMVSPLFCAGVTAPVSTAIAISAMKAKRAGRLAGNFARTRNNRAEPDLRGFVHQFYGLGHVGVPFGGCPGWYSHRLAASGVRGGAPHPVMLGGSHPRAYTP